jgi:hypothetical protein
VPGPPPIEGLAVLQPFIYIFVHDDCQASIE